VVFLFSFSPTRRFCGTHESGSPPPSSSADARPSFVLEKDSLFRSFCLIAAGGDFPGFTSVLIRTISPIGDRTTPSSRSSLVKPLIIHK